MYYIGSSIYTKIYSIKLHHIIVCYTISSFFHEALSPSTNAPTAMNSTRKYRETEGKRRVRLRTAVPTDLFPPVENVHDISAPSGGESNFDPLQAARQPLQVSTLRTHGDSAIQRLEQGTGDCGSRTRTAAHSRPGGGCKSKG